MELAYYNLNQCRKVTLHKKTRTKDFEWVELDKTPLWEKLLNIFRKKVFRKHNIERMIVSTYFSRFNDDYYTKKDFFEKYGEHYDISYKYDIIYHKPHVSILMSDGSLIERYFEENKEAEDFFDKIMGLAHEKNVPLFNFHCKQ